MSSKDEEYKEIFLAEAQENHEELNKLLTKLEKDPKNKDAVNAIFRITHTLKGNAAGMGFKKVSDFAHVMEDLFGEVREGKLTLDESIFGSLFKAADTLGDLIESVSSGKKVSFRGIKTKLEVLIRKADEEEQEKETNASEKKPQEKEKKSSEGQPVESDQEHVEEDQKGVSSEETDEEETKDEEELTAEASSRISFSDVVQVPVRKLDSLLNLVGELVIERDRIISAHADKMASNEYARLNRISSDLQYSVMDVRLVQVGFLFNKFHRVVRDAAASEKKKVALELVGTDTEIDRNILQTISDSLIHLIRNAVGHGIESPAERKKAKKKEEGVITLAARSESDSVVIDIKDDGSGIDVEKVKQKAVERGLITREDKSQISDNDAALLIFEPGFSTMSEITSISGRGVGMDVVKRALDSIGGTIAVHTEPGKGSIFSLSLPASMAVKGTLLFELSTNTYALPLSSTEAVVSRFKKELHEVNATLMTRYQEQTIPVVFLSNLIRAESVDKLLSEKEMLKRFDELKESQKINIVVVSYGNRMVGLIVDKLLQQKEIVEKPLMKPVDKVKICSGVTILGNGNVCLVLNVSTIINMLFSKNVANQNKVSALTN